MAPGAGGATVIYFVHSKLELVSLHMDELRLDGGMGGSETSIRPIKYINLLWLGYYTIYIFEKETL